MDEKEYLQTLGEQIVNPHARASVLAEIQDHIEEQAQELFDRLMKQRAEREGITEKLKADNQMEWVGRMSNLRSAVTETVNAEVIFV